MAIKVFCLKRLLITMPAAPRREARAKCQPAFSGTIRASAQNHHRNGSETIGNRREQTHVQRILDPSILDQLRNPETGAVQSHREQK